MDIRILEELRRLQHEIHNCLHNKSNSLTTVERATLLDLFRNIDIAIIRLAAQAQVDSDIDDAFNYKHMHEAISRAVSAFQEDKFGIHAVLDNLDTVRRAVSFVIAHVEPNEPWPRK